MILLPQYNVKVRTLVRDTASTVFTNDDLNEYIQGAVLIYSAFKTIRKPYTLSLQSGQNQYSLPNDWMKPDLTSFNEATNQTEHIDLHQFASFVLPTINGAPRLEDLSFDWYNESQMVMVNPMPLTNQDINFAYYAVHTLSDTQSSIPDFDAQALSLAAASQALDALAIEKGLKMQKYKVSQSIQIDDSEVAKRLQEQAGKYYSQFEQLIRFRPMGVMG